ncbi:MAG: DUF2489 domain-containing protein [Hahellaceae bacterium]|jgi:hypothetical protein|nr:DUF2489 domain-containing protein [Hahellaceae bacterium]MCP5209603.1 DUF2489 domain-containing protein [Hahellaceae bacterium]
MPETVTWILSALGILCAFVMLVFINKQWTRIRLGEKIAQQKNEQKEQSRREIKSGLRVLSLSLIEEQIDLAEGCIRIKVLLDAIAPELHNQPDFAVFNMMYEETSHMPTHGARQEMDKRFRRKLDKQRFELESRHRTQIKSAATKLFNVLETL